MRLNATRKDSTTHFVVLILLIVLVGPLGAAQASLLGFSRTWFRVAIIKGISERLDDYKDDFDSNDGSFKLISLKNRSDVSATKRVWHDYIVKNYVSLFFPRGTIDVLGMTNARKLFPVKSLVVQHQDTNFSRQGEWHVDSNMFDGESNVIFTSVATLNPSPLLRSGTLYPPNGWTLNHRFPNIDTSVYEKDGARSADDFGAISTHLTEGRRGLYALGIGSGGTYHRIGIDVYNDRITAVLAVGWEPEAVRLRGGPLGKRLVLIHWQYVIDKATGLDRSSSLMPRLLVTTLDDFIPEEELGCVYDEIIREYEELSMTLKADIRQTFGGQFPPGFPNECRALGGACRPVD